MAKVIEVWRKNSVPGLPVRFTVGSVPMFIGADGTLTATDGPVVSSITHLAADQACLAPCYRVSFKDSQIRRFIPVSDVADVAVDATKKEKVSVPELPE